jgi:hypothetical protein
MKKIFLAVSLLLCLMPKQGIAQIESGMSTISGALDTRFNQNFTYGTLSANQTKFINPNLGIGAGFSASILTSTNVTSSDLNLGGTGMYIFNPSNKAPFYAEIGLGTGINTSNSNGQNFRTSLLRSKVAVGNFFFLNKNVALNTALSWNRLAYKILGFNFNQNDINLTVSLAPFLQGSLFSKIELEEGESLFAANRISVKGEVGYYGITSKYLGSVSHIRKDIEASFFLAKGLEIGAGLTDMYFSPFATLYLQMQPRVGILGELKYQKVIEKNNTESSTWIPSLGGAYFLNKNIAIIGKLSYYPSRLSAFNGTGISLNLKYFLK